MTTQAQTPQQEGEQLPRYFADFLIEFGKFREENERQHGALRTETHDLVAALRTEIQELRTEMHREFASQIRWIIGTIGGMGLAIIGSIIYVASRIS